MNFKRIVTARNYRIDVTVDQFLIMTNRESICSEFAGPYLSEQLDDLDGVDDADYNGHFGAHIYVRIEPEHDTEERWVQIEALVAQAVRTDSLHEKTG